MPVVTADDGSGGRTGNQFLPGPRLVPSCLGIPEGKEKYPKKTNPVVWVPCSGQRLNALERRRAFLSPSLSHCRLIFLQPCRGSPAHPKSFSCIPGSPAQLGFAGSPGAASPLPAAE